MEWPVRRTREAGIRTREIREDKKGVVAWVNGKARQKHLKETVRKVEERAEGALGKRVEFNCRWRAGLNTSFGDLTSWRINGQRGDRNHL